MEYYNACNLMNSSYVDTSLKEWYHVWDSDEHEYQK